MHPADRPTRTIARAGVQLFGELFGASGLPWTPALQRALERAPLQVTPPLHLRPRAVAAWRLVLVGDAAGYVEPFTGEGLAWALDGARELSLLLPELLGSDTGVWPARAGARWTASHRRRVARRQRTCHAVGALVRRPRALDATLALLSRAPRLAAPLLLRMNAP